MRGSVTDKKIKGEQEMKKKEMANDILTTIAVLYDTVYSVTLEGLFPLSSSIASLSQVRKMW